MSEAPELPPLPEPPSDRKLWTWAYTSADMKAYGRACQAPLLAEIERLKNSLGSAAIAEMADSTVPVSEGIVCHVCEDHHTKASKRLELGEK